MSLPLPAIDRIFERLTAAYGRQFLDLYADIDAASVKTAWGHELAMCSNAAGLRRIAWALDNLPERVPNPIQFRNLCRQAPVTEPLQLAAPPANPERAADAVAEARKVSAASAHRIDGKAWARRLVEREKAGEVLGYTISRFAHAALKNERNREGEAA